LLPARSAYRWEEKHGRLVAGNLPDGLRLTDFPSCGLVHIEPLHGVLEMTEEKITIVLRDGDKEEFEEIMKTMRVPKNVSTKVDVVRRLMSFYKANSPLMREVE